MSMHPGGPVTVREALGVLRRWQARTLAGAAGLDRSVMWCTAMRARLPAFDHLQTGEFSLVSMEMVRALRARVMSLSLPGVVRQLADLHVAAIGIADLRDDVPLSPDEARNLAAARALADDRGVPLIALAANNLGEIEHELIAYLIARRERHPLSAEPSAVDAARLRESLRGEALEALLTGTFTAEHAMRSRALQLGFDLSRPHVVLWVDLAPHRSPADATNDTFSPREADPTAAHVSDELAASLKAWTRARAGEVAALLPLPRDGGGYEALTQSIDALLTRALPAQPWSAGLGEPATATAEVHRSANEARDAARLGVLVRGARHVVRATELGVYRLLVSLRDAGELAPFVERTLAPLRRDPRYGDKLVESLDAYLACNGNVSQAKERLHLHRNSLSYRLARASELLGRDLDDPETRLALDLALRGRRVLDTTDHA
jgi:sugar diacid utilization regulator